MWFTVSGVALIQELQELRFSIHHRFTRLLGHQSCSRLFLQFVPLVFPLCHPYLWPHQTFDKSTHILKIYSCGCFFGVVASLAPTPVTAKIFQFWALFMFNPFVSILRVIIAYCFGHFWKMDLSHLPKFYSPGGLSSDSYAVNAFNQEGRFDLICTQQNFFSSKASAWMRWIIGSDPSCFSMILALTK